MAARIGLGPVFAFEWLISSRRWRNYALRSLFVLGLLIAMGVVYQARSHRMTGPTLKAQAAAGEALFMGIVGVQLALIMLAAPAATAGAICLDKARGTLQHVLMTDLSDTEIVLGKLAARLAPTLMLVGCTLPVMAVGTLLGGIDPIALTGAFLITLGLAFLGCALAFAFSVWGKKTHEVLLATYSVWMVWLLASPMAHQARAYVPGWASWPLDQLEACDPYRLAYGPYSRPGSVSLADDVAFLFVTLALSGALAALCVWRMRPVALRDFSRGERRTRWPLWMRRRLGSPLSRLPGPSLDWDPVLWREWHRNRPSRWTAFLWAIYLVGAAVFTVLAMISPGGVAAWVNGLQVSVGLLMLSVSAATSLAEERTRGSLDVLLTTPLSTRRIVVGKLLGAARMVPLMALLPTIAVFPSVIATSRGATGAVLFWLGLWGQAVLVLAQGTAIVSLGVALATWVPKLGRAVALTVSAHVMMTVGWLFLMLLLFHHQTFEWLGMASPFFGAGNITFWLTEGRTISLDGPILFGAWFWAIAYSVVSALLIIATLLTFNRCLGRVEGPLHGRRSTVLPAAKVFLDHEIDQEPALAQLAQMETT